jgi:hypothetical protein
VSGGGRRRAPKRSSLVDDPDRLGTRARCEQELGVGALIAVLHALMDDDAARFVTGVARTPPARPAQAAAGGLASPS